VTSAVTPSVALIGATGFGGVHLERTAPLLAAGRFRLTGVCDVKPLTAEERSRLPTGTFISTDHRELLEHLRPDAVIVATPPHTHTAIVADALRAGSDVLVEKPPFARLTDHDQIAALERETGRRCQVGFQHLASPALAELLAAISTGRLGTVRAVALAGAWTRPDAYYARTRWAGRRWMDGEPVPDGALSNPFAHGVMGALALAAAATGGAEGHTLELELYRTRDIEVEDTGCLRLRLPGQVQVLAAVTLCAQEQRPPRLLVDGTKGRALLDYPVDRLQLPGDPEPRHVPGRASLIENLLDHREDPERTALLAPLERVRPFTRVVEAIHGSPPPQKIEERYFRVEGAGPDRRIVIEGIDGLVDRAAEEAALFWELDVPWAGPPSTRDLPG
jgi:predicted dehydrogenase